MPQYDADQGQCLAVRFSSPTPSQALFFVQLLFFFTRFAACKVTGTTTTTAGDRQQQPIFENSNFENERTLRSQVAALSVALLSAFVFIERTLCLACCSSMLLTAFQMLPNTIAVGS